MQNPQEYIEEINKAPNAFNVLTDRCDSEINYCDYLIKKLDSRLKQWLNANPGFKAPKIRVPVDKDRENKLKSLGYLQ
jgi:hypothetical protein